MKALEQLLLALAYRRKPSTLVKSMVKRSLKF